MAEIKIPISVELANALPKLKQLTGELDKVGNEAETAVGAVAKVGESANKIADTGVKSFKAQLREANQELLLTVQRFGATSPAAQAAAARVAELKDNIGDAKLLSDAFNPDAKFTALANSLKGAVGGVTALQGAMALFGDKSKAVEETLAKVQGAMALSQGLNAILESKDAFIALGSSAKAALAGIRTGIAATGIGVLLIALGAVVAYWDDIKAAVSGVTDAQMKQAEAAKANVETETKKLEALDNQANVLKLQGKSEKEILALKLKQYDQVINAAIAQEKIDKENRARQDEATARNYKYLKSALDFISYPQRKLYEFFSSFVNNAINVLNKIPGVKIDFKLDEKFVEESSDWIAKQLFDPEKAKAESKKAAAAADENIKKLQNQKAGVQLEIKGGDKAKKDVQTVDEALKNLREQIDGLNRVGLVMNTNTLPDQIKAVESTIETLLTDKDLKLKVTPEQIELLKRQLRELEKQEYRLTFKPVKILDTSPAALQKNKDDIETWAAGLKPIELKVDPKARQAAFQPIYDSAAQQKFMERTKDLAAQTNQMLSAGFADAISGFAEGLGNAISGQGNLTDAFKSGLMAIGAMMQQIGKLFIQQAIAVELFKKTIFTNTAVAIVAGAALIAAGAAIKNATSKKFASGGFVSGPGSEKSDSIPAMLSNGEYVINAASVRKFGVGFFNNLNSGMLRFATGGLVAANQTMTPVISEPFGQMIPYIASTEVRGQDLRIVLNRANSRFNNSN